MNRGLRTRSTIVKMAGRWPAVVPLTLWLAAVAWPFLALIGRLVQSSAVETRSGLETSHHALGTLMLTSLGWSVVTAVLATAVGWMPGRLMGLLLARKGFLPVVAVIIVPLCLPSYVVFYAWWQAWPAGTALHRWVIEHNAMQWAREGTLLLGLVCWSWPLAALCVAGASSRRPRSRDELLAIDGAPRWLMLMDRFRSDLPGLAMGGFLVFLATLHNTTCFDLAEVFTFANELRARQALGASPHQTLYAAMPMMLIAALGAWVIWWRLGLTRGESAVSVSRPSLVAILLTILIWCVSVLVPLSLFWHGGWAAGGFVDTAREYAQLYGSNTMSTLCMAMVAGVLAAAGALGLFIMWRDESSAIRCIAHVIGISWVFWSLLPGTILGLALQAAWDKGGWISDLMYRSSVILTLAHLAGSGFIAVLLARWAACSEPRVLSDLVRLNAVRGLRGSWWSARPPILAVIAATCAIVIAFSAGEIAITAQVIPPLPMDRTPIAMTLLNEMHYQRPQTVMVASILFLVLGTLAAAMLALGWSMVQSLGRHGRARNVVVSTPIAAMVVFVMLMASGCGRAGSAEPRPLRVDHAFGSPGSGLGQFGYPRCLAVDLRSQHVYVIDKTARVQRFGFDGEPQLQWHMPQKDNGKPTGITVAPDGTVYVADTHYFRVIAYDAEGNELQRFGEYGQGPGQFIYLTDIAIAPNGNLYVAEYGGNDRVQVFSPDGDYLFEFGSFGKGEGQFSRPQSIAFSADGTELYVSDACNHRIVVTDLSGRWLRTIGTPGRGIGELAYPYGLDVLPDGTLLVAEFGNNRIQRFSSDGRSLGVRGRIGRGNGELQYPWAVAAAGDRIFVLDSGNNRVQVIRRF